MRIDIVSLFPEMFAGALDASIVGRARASGALTVALHNPRDYTHDRHRVVDDYPFGGGPGMVMKPEPLFECVEAVREMASAPGRVVLLTPQGRLLDHAVVAELAAEQRLIIICGHYEGVDERVREHLADDEISIGDYVLSGGEPAAIVLVDAVARHQPGVLGSEESLTEESHAAGLLEYPQYTRPAEYRGMAVPEPLLSGHHAQIARWRRRESIERTARRRPDMLVRASLTPAERRIAAATAPGATPEERAHVTRVALAVDALEAAAAYYAALLGDAGDRVAPDEHAFQCGAVTLACVEAPGVAAGGALEVSFAVPDLRAAHKRAKAAGSAWVENRPRRRANGERAFHARDPFGHRLCFIDEATLAP